MDLFWVFVPRFAKKRAEEDLEIARRTLEHLKEQNEASSVTDKLQQELGEYREIVKCSICQDRTKEVMFYCAMSYEMSFMKLLKLQFNAR